MTSISSDLVPALIIFFVKTLIGLGCFGAKNLFLGHRQVQLIFTVVSDCGGFQFILETTQFLRLDHVGPHKGHNLNFNDFLTHNPS